MMATLLLTATVCPPKGVPHLVRTDPRQRLSDYSAALRFYLTRTRLIRRIIFVDNSASDLAPLRAIANQLDTIETVFVSFAGLDYPVAYGRAYGEVRLIREAIARCDFNPDEPFWKVTGRLRVENIDRLVCSVRKQYQLYCDLRRWPRRWMELRVFSSTPSGFERWLGDNLQGIRQDRIEDSAYIAPEEWLFDRIATELADPTLIPRFKVQPIFAGHSGTTGVDYGGLRKRLAYRAKMIARYIMPRLWI